MLLLCPRERGQDWDAKAHVGQWGKYVRLEFSLENSCATSGFTAGYRRPLPNDDLKHSVKKTSCAVFVGEEGIRTQRRNCLEKKSNADSLFSCLLEMGPCLALLQREPVRPPACTNKAPSEPQQAAFAGKLHF